MPPRPKSAIPVGTQFSPALLDLGPMLKAFIANSGNVPALKAAVWTAPVHKSPPASVPTSRRRVSLPLEAAVQYGLLEETTYQATQLAKDLDALSGSALDEAFARHIMLNLGGLRVVEGAEQMKADGLRITGDTLAVYLTNQGFTVTEHNTAINTLRMWLARVGVFSKTGWEVDTAAKERVLGLADDAIAALVGLNDRQRAFVVALCHINPTTWTLAADVRELAEATSGLRLERSSLPNQYLRPLADVGLIEFKSGGTAGGKSAKVRTTAKFKKDVLEPFVTQTVKSMDAAIAAYYKTRPEDIYADLESSDTFKKGQALEAYAVYLMRLLGLRFRAWRLRAKDSTGSAEVDAILDGVIGSVPSRWQVQCKNTPGSRKVSLEDVAKEVGLVPLTHSTHVMLVANNGFTKDAENFAAAINQRTAITVFLLDQRDFQTVKSSPGALGGILKLKAENVLKQAPPEMPWAAS